MPLLFENESPAALEALHLLRDVITSQNEVFGKISVAEARMKGLGTETDREEYQQLCKQTQILQKAREKARDKAIELCSKPEIVTSYEASVPREFSGHY